MEKYYQILGITPGASVAEIRKAYRKKVKEYHPDKSSKKTSEEFQLVVKAYRILSAERTEKFFDENPFYHKTSGKHKDEFNYRDWLSARNDQESRAKLIFFDLMHGREDDAVAEFKRMSMEHADFSLKRWFTREDFMDYGYILAEELYFRSEYYDAIILLEQIIRMEYSFSYFKLFFPDVIDFTKNILKRHIEGKLSDELAIDAWERALDLNLGKSDDTFFLYKMADAYKRLGDSNTAEICREEALRLSR